MELRGFPIQHSVGLPAGSKDGITLDLNESNFINRQEFLVKIGELMLADESLNREDLMNEWSDSPLTVLQHETGHLAGLHDVTTAQSNIVIFENPRRAAEDELPRKTSRGQLIDGFEK